MNYAEMMGRFFKILFVIIGLVAVIGIGAAMWGMQDLDRHNKMSPAERKAEQAVYDAKRAADAKRSLVEHSDGQHCLSSISGQNADVIDALKQGLREPDSFEHISTRIGSVDASGNHELVMRYRARNGFGGMAIGTATALVRNSDCAVTITGNTSR